MTGPFLWGCVWDTILTLAPKCEYDEPCQTSLKGFVSPLPRGVAGVDVLPHVEPDLHLGQAARGDRVVESAGHGDHCSCGKNITITAALSNTYTGPRLGHD